MEIRELNDGSPQARRTQIIVLVLCFLLEFLDGFDVFAIAFTAPTIAQEWSLAPQVLGLVFTVGVIGMAIGAMFVASIADLIGRRALLLGCLVLITVGMVLTGLASTLDQLLWLRCITGIGIGAMLASLTALVSEYAPQRHRSFAITVMHSSYGFGGMLGGFVAASMIPRYGWDSVYFLGGAIGLVLLPLVFIGLPESVHFLLERRPRDTLAKVNQILRRLGAAPLTELPPAEAAPEPPTVFALLATTRRRATLLLWLAFFMSYLPLFFLLNWMPKIIVDAGFSLESGIYAGITFNMGTIVGEWILGYLADRRSLRRLITGYMLAAAGSMLLFAFAPQTLWLLLSLSFVIGFFVLGGFVGLYIVATRIYPTVVRSTGVGWGIGAGRFGAILGPYLGGVLIGAQWSTTASFMFFACPLLITGLAVYLMRDPVLQ